jgi:hypothetical protein
MRVDFGLRLPLAGYNNTRERMIIPFFPTAGSGRSIIGYYDLVRLVAGCHWLNISSAERVYHNNRLIRTARPYQV